MEKTMTVEEICAKFFEKDCKVHLKYADSTHGQGYLKPPSWGHGGYSNVEFECEDFSIGFDYGCGMFYCAHNKIRFHSESIAKERAESIMRGMVEKDIKNELEDLSRKQKESRERFNHFLNGQ